MYVKFKEMKICVDVEIKQTKVMLCYIKMQFISMHCIKT